MNAFRVPSWDREKLPPRMTLFNDEFFVTLPSLTDEQLGALVAQAAMSRAHRIIYGSKGPKPKVHR